jgi:hypothetical protein
MLFTFYRAQSSIDPKINATIEVSNDLLTWPASSAHAIPISAAANNPGISVTKGVPVGFDTVVLQMPTTPEVKKFARLNVVVAP